MDKVFLKDLRRLVHYVLTHDHEQLSALIRCRLTVSEVALHYLDDCPHFLLVALEFY